MIHDRIVHLETSTPHLAITSYTTTSSGAAAGASMVFLIVFIAIFVFYIIAMWRIYEKAGQPGWATIIPFYNTWVLLKIVGRPGWWFILLFIPFVNIVIDIILLNDLSKSFGHGAGFTVGLLFLSIIFFPILAFGDSRYLGPAAMQGIPPSGYPGYYGGMPSGPGYPASGYAPYSSGQYGPTYSGSPGSGVVTGGGGPAPVGNFTPGSPYGTTPNPVMPAGVSAAPTPTPAGWYGDPSGRHQYRYWNGTAWTEQVMSNNTQSVDPLPPA